MRTMLILTLILGCACGAKNGKDGKDAKAPNIDRLTERVAALEILYASLAQIVNVQDISIVDIESRLEDIEAIQYQYEIIIDDLYYRVQQLEMRDSLQASELDALQADLADLDIIAENQIREVVDPCASGGEVLLRLGSNQVVAYYQSGNGNNQNRYLAVIAPGTYQTTDGTNCTFIVKQNGEVE